MDREKFRVESNNLLNSFPKVYLKLLYLSNISGPFLLFIIKESESLIWIVTFLKWSCLTVQKIDTKLIW